MVMDAPSPLTGAVSVVVVVVVVVELVSLVAAGVPELVSVPHAAMEHPRTSASADVIILFFIFYFLSLLRD